MNTSLLARQFGASSERAFQQDYTTKLLHALQPANLKFDGGGVSVSGVQDDDEEELDGQGEEDQAVPDDVDKKLLAHTGGVNAVVVDRFEGRYLLSGGADSKISIWDLEASSQDGDGETFVPLASTTKAKSSGAHKFGITALNYYPFDSLAFTSSSYDYTLKLFSSETLTASATFNLESIVYDHASSTIARHLLVACATQHPNVRLVDLRSGSAAQALPGHKGAVLSVAWSTRDENILVSGGQDGTIRFWDVRRSAAQLGCLDMDDSIGVSAGFIGAKASHRGAQREPGKAHHGPVNGLTWSEDGRHLVSAGHDEKVRVWDTTRGANTLTNFGPLIRNRDLRRNVPCLVPTNFMAQGSEALLIANEREILMFDLLEGKLLKRLRAPGVSFAGASSGAAAQRHKVIDLGWRHGNIEFFSAHGDGCIRAWRPRTAEDALADDEDREEEILAEEEKRRKRKVFEDIYSDLSRKALRIG